MLDLKPTSGFKMVIYTQAYATASVLVSSLGKCSQLYEQNLHLRAIVGGSSSKMMYVKACYKLFNST